MFGIFFLILLSILGYYGYHEGMKRWQKYLEDKLEIEKNRQIPAMTDVTFNALLGKNFIPWAKSVGILK